MPFRRFSVQIVFGLKSRHPIEGTVFIAFRKVLYRTLVTAAKPVASTAASNIAIRATGSAPPRRH